LKPASNLQGVAPRSATGRGAVDELTPEAADRVPLFPVNDVHATVSDGSVVLRWQRVPLDRVLAYRVYRTDQAGEHLLGTVDNTPAPEFVDKAPAKGAVKYFVTAVFAPHSLAAQRAPEAVPELVLFRPITSAVEIGAIRERAPTQTAEWERAGITAPPTRASAKPTKVLLETDRSEAAAVIVK